MSKPIKDEGTSFAVICHTCGVNVWQGNDPPADGQVLLTAFADSIPRPACPSGRVDCPHKAVEVAKKPKRRNATVADLDVLAERIAKLEKK